MNQAVRANMSFNTDALRRPGAARLGASRRRLTLRYPSRVASEVSQRSCQYPGRLR